MPIFKAVFWDAKVVVNQKHQYPNNEILVRYLNAPLDYLKREYDNLLAAADALMLTAETSNKIDNAGYDARAQDIQKLMTSIDRKRFSLSPYNTFYEESEYPADRLVQCLNQYRQHKQTETTNAEIRFLLEEYAEWVADALRIRRVYGVLLTDFIHSKHAFLSPPEAAEQVEKYLQSENVGGKPYMRLGAPQPVSVSCEVFSPAGQPPVLGDSYTFDSLGAFLYADFFRGLKNNYLPQKCGGCKKWFLLPHGQYSEYCNQADDAFYGKESKPCRSMGARQKFASKCKSDPVWLAYSRAYKAHYARYMKAKMSKAEFENWGAYAIVLRKKALESKLDFEEYQRLIRE